MNNKIRFFYTLLMSLACSSMAATLSFVVTDTQNQAVKDAVITLHSPKLQTPPPVKRTLAQTGYQFTQFVLVVPKNSLVAFPNTGIIKHQIYTHAQAKRFELSLADNQLSESSRFTHVGVVPVGCKIHEWMIAYIYVVDTPYYTQTNEMGRATISGIVPGDYQLVLWQPRLDTKNNQLQQRITVQSADQQLNFHHLKIQRTMHAMPANLNDTEY